MQLALTHSSVGKSPSVPLFQRGKQRRHTASCGALFIGIIFYRGKAGWQIMKNISITKKLVLLLSLPLIGLIVYAALSAQQSYREWRSLVQTESLMKFAVSAGNLVHYLQIERGATAGFVQSKGEKFTHELPGYRAETDKTWRCSRQATSRWIWRTCPMPAPGLKRPCPN